MPTLGFLGTLGMPELLIILVILLLLFGANKLPGLFRSMGKSVGEFKKGMKEDSDDSLMDGQEEETKSTE